MTHQGPTGHADDSGPRRDHSPAGTSTHDDRRPGRLHHAHAVSSPRPDLRRHVPLRYWTPDRGMTSEVESARGRRRPRRRHRRRTGPPAGRPGHPARGRPGRRHQPQPGTGAGAHHGPLGHGWPATGRRGQHSGSKDLPPKPNLKAILANSDRVARHAFEKKHLADQLRRNGIDLVEHLGPVHFTDPYTLTAGDGRSLAGRAHHPGRRRTRRTPAHPRERAGPYLQRHSNPDGSACGRGRRRRGRHRMPDRLHPRRPGQPRQPVRSGPSNRAARRPQHLGRTRSSVPTSGHRNAHQHNGELPYDLNKTGSSSNTPARPQVGRNRRGRRLLRRRMAPQHRAVGA